MDEQQLQARIKELEGQLAASEGRYQEIVRALDHVPTGIEIYDRDGYAEYLNPAMMKMIALPSTESVLGKFNILTDPFSEETGMKVLYERAYRGELVHTEEFMVEMERASDDWGTGARSAWFRMVLVPIKDLEGQVERVFAIMFETTQQRQMKETLEIASRRDGLELLAGGVAHDYNNLLTAIMMSAGMVELASDGSGEAAELVQEILLAGRQAMFLTAQLMAYAGESHQVVKSSDIARLTGETARMLESTLSSSVTLTLVEGESEITSLVNEGQLKQVLMNLITNARDALPDDGGEITVAVSEVDLGEEECEQVQFGAPLSPGPWNCIEVTDNGCGIDEATIGRIFEPYFTTKETGHGLGLAAAVGIVRSYEGGIQVSSRPGHGTRFRIYLKPVNERLDAAEVVESGPMPPLRRVVVADDSTFVRASLGQVLRRLGAEVMEAANGAEAVTLALSDKGAPDLILMDLMMPVMNGLDALNAIREVAPNQAVILMSAHAETAARRAERDPATWFITKPFELEALTSIISKALIG